MLNKFFQGNICVFWFSLRPFPFNANFIFPLPLFSFFPYTLIFYFFFIQPFQPHNQTSNWACFTFKDQKPYSIRIYKQIKLNLKNFQGYRYFVFLNYNFVILNFPHHSLYLFFRSKAIMNQFYQPIKKDR